MYLHGESDDDPEAFVSTVAFVVAGQATEVTMQLLFASREERDQVIERYHAVEGGRQTLGRLAEYLATSSERGAQRKDR